MGIISLSNSAKLFMRIITEFALLFFCFPILYSQQAQFINTSLNGALDSRGYALGQAVVASTATKLGFKVNPATLKSDGIINIYISYRDLSLFGDVFSFGAIGTTPFGNFAIDHAIYNGLESWHTLDQGPKTLNVIYQRDATLTLSYSYNFKGFSPGMNIKLYKPVESDKSFFSSDKYDSHLFFDFGLLLEFQKLIPDLFNDKFNLGLSLQNIGEKNKSYSGYSDRTYSIPSYFNIGFSYQPSTDGSVLEFISFELLGQIKYYLNPPKATPYGELYNPDSERYFVHLGLETSFWNVLHVRFGADQYHMQYFMGKAFHENLYASFGLGLKIPTYLFNLESPFYLTLDWSQVNYKWAANRPNIFIGFGY